MSLNDAMEAFLDAGAQTLGRRPEDDPTTAPQRWKEDTPIPSQAPNLNVKSEYQEDPGSVNVLTTIVAGPLVYAVLRDGFGVSNGTSLAAGTLTSLVLYRNYTGFVRNRVSSLLGKVGEVVDGDLTK